MNAQALIETARLMAMSRSSPIVILGVSSSPAGLAYRLGRRNISCSTPRRSAFSLMNTTVPISRPSRSGTRLPSKCSTQHATSSAAIPAPPKRKPLHSSIQPNWIICASTQFVSWRWTLSRKPIAAIPVCRWARHPWPMCCGRSFSGTTQPIPSGSIGTALSCRPVTVRCCCTACCISPAMRCHSTKSNDSANGAGYAARIWFHRGQHLRTRYEVNRSETSEHLADDCRRQSDCAQAATRCG